MSADRPAALRASSRTDRDYESSDARARRAPPSFFYNAARPVDRVHLRASGMEAWPAQ
jgi:hypothetical protein